MFGIYRNIPFAILGALLIYWSYLKKDKAGLKNMSLYIFLSFLFYIPVVLFADTYKIVGVFMIPKTMAYLMIVILGYRYFIKGFEKRNILGLSYTFLIMGLILGVFYREFTKFYNYRLVNHLSKLHVHVLVLGFLLMLIIYIISKNYDLGKIHYIKIPIYLYVVGFAFTIVNMTLIGIYQVFSPKIKILNQAAIDGFSGIGHIILSVGLVWLILRIFKIESNN